MAMHHPQILQLPLHMCACSFFVAHGVYSDIYTLEDLHGHGALSPESTGLEPNPKSSGRSCDACQPTAMKHVPL